jgi:hypothetical protein
MTVSCIIDDDFIGCHFQVFGKKSPCLADTLKAAVIPAVCPSGRFVLAAYLRVKHGHGQVQLLGRGFPPGHVQRQDPFFKILIAF